MKMRPRTRFVLAGLIFALQTGAQTAAPPPAGPVDNSQGLEVEMVDVGNRMAIPSQINRPAGQFILVVTNRTQDPTAWFVVDAAPAAQSSAAAGAAAAPQASGHFLVIGSGQNERKRRAGAIFDAALGTYQLKSGAAGNVLCTIVIQ